MFPDDNPKLTKKERQIVEEAKSLKSQKEQRKSATPS
jgi:hypothetical protein